MSYWINQSKIKKLFFNWLVHRVNHVVSVGQTSKNDFINTYTLSALQELDKQLQESRNEIINLKNEIDLLKNNINR